MASATAMADRQIVSLVLHHLSDMKYKDRRQQGPDQPVEFLEFRPTLVPSILVNKLWASEGTSILWRRYPHLPALSSIRNDRRQWYASKVQRAFIVSPEPDAAEDLEYLETLSWPSLKTLELEVDWKRHGKSLYHMLKANLEHLEISGEQSGSSKYIAEVVLPAFLNPHNKLQSIHIGPEMMNPEDAVHSQVLSNLLVSNTSIRNVCVMNANLIGSNKLLEALAKRPGLEELKIDLEPGLQLLPLFTSASDLFTSLRRLHVMCYPEIAWALPSHLPSIESLSLDIARIPDQPPIDMDRSILDGLLSSCAQLPHLQLLKINVGQLASGFPSATSLPTLEAVSLAQVAAACPQLEDLTLLASEPAAIDGSQISGASFDDFCRLAPNLTNLSLKLHPGTTLALEESALQSLGRHCRRLETLRLKVALQIPSLTTQATASPAHISRDNTFDTGPAEKGNAFRTSGLQPNNGDFAEIKSYTAAIAGSVVPLFPHLAHLALARPQSVLSVVTDTYSASSISHSSSEVDPSLEEDLVRCWAQALLLHFPRVDVLEAWGDWTGHDNDSLNYFLPREEPLASTWEFLSGIEQDLWEDEEDVPNEIQRLADDFEDHISFDSRGSGDWDRASLVNEFPEDIEYGDGQYLDAYDDEPEDMNTPVIERHEWLPHTNSKLATTTF